MSLARGFEWAHTVIGRVYPVRKLYDILDKGFSTGRRESSSPLRDASLGRNSFHRHDGEK